ncbi:MAG: thiol-disulfide isomerase [Congregibacter sp.]
MSSESLTVIVALLGVVVTLMLIVVFALARQIGILHTRLAPAGALMTEGGPEVGAPSPKLSLRDISDKPVRIGGSGAGALLVLFVSPNCPICKELVPVAQSMARTEKLRLIFASDGGELTQHQGYINKMELRDYPYVISSELGMKLGADKLPYAALIDDAGILRSRGLVNSREHLESLVEAMLSGYDSLQDYMLQEQLLEQAS